MTQPIRLATVLLAFVAGGALVSCTTDTWPDGNIFLRDRAPRYGYGGTDQPRYKYGATETAPPSAPQSRGETKYLDERKPRYTASSDSGASGRSDGAGSGSDVADEVEVSEVPPRQSDPAPEASSPAPAPKPKPSVAADIPYAVPVPGRDGIVYSPFNNAPVDVSGMPSGTEVRCPHTKKIFRVP